MLKHHLAQNLRLIGSENMRKYEGHRSRAQRARVLYVDSPDHVVQQSRILKQKPAKDEGFEPFRPNACCTPCEPSEKSLQKPILAYPQEPSVLWLLYFKSTETREEEVKRDSETKKKGS